MTDIKIERSDDSSSYNSRKNLNLPNIVVSVGGLDSARSVSQNSRQIVSARSPSRSSNQSERISQTSKRSFNRSASQVANQKRPSSKKVVKKLNSMLDPSKMLLNKEVSLMGQTTQDVLKSKIQNETKGRDYEIQSEARKNLSQKPPLKSEKSGKVFILPTGVIDERNLDEQIIQERDDEYQNFDGNSFFASSLADHDRHYEIDSAKEKMQSSLGGWYQPEREDSVKNKKKRKQQKPKKQENEGRLAQIKEHSMLSKINLQLRTEQDLEVSSVASNQSRLHQQRESTSRMSQNNKEKRNSFYKQSSVQHSMRLDHNLRGQPGQNLQTQQMGQENPSGIDLEKAALEYQEYQRKLQEQIDAGMQTTTDGFGLAKGHPTDQQQFYSQLQPRQIVYPNQSSVPQQLPPVSQRGSLSPTLSPNSKVFFQNNSQSNSSLLNIVTPSSGNQHLNNNLYFVSQQQAQKMLIQDPSYYESQQKLQTLSPAELYKLAQNQNQQSPKVPKKKVKEFSSSFSKRAMSNAVPSPKALLQSPFLYTQAVKNEANQIAITASSPQTEKEKLVTISASAAAQLKNKKPYMGRAKLQLRSGSVPPIAPSPVNKRDYGISSQGHNLNKSLKTKAGLVKSPSESILDMNDLPTQPNRKFAEEEQKRMIDALYPNTDFKIKKQPSQEPQDAGSLQPQPDLSPKTQKALKGKSKGYPPLAQQIGAASYYKLDQGYLDKFNEQIKDQGKKRKLRAVKRSSKTQLGQLGNHMNLLPLIEQGKLRQQIYSMNSQQQVFMQDFNQLPGMQTVTIQGNQYQMDQNGQLHIPQYIQIPYATTQRESTPKDKRQSFEDQSMTQRKPLKVYQKTFHDSNSQHQNRDLNDVQGGDNNRGSKIKKVKSSLDPAAKSKQGNSPPPIYINELINDEAEAAVTQFQPRRPPVVVSKLNPKFQPKVRRDQVVINGVVRKLQISELLDQRQNGNKLPQTAIKTSKTGLGMSATERKSPIYFENSMATAEEQNGPDSPLPLNIQDEGHEIMAPVILFQQTLVSTPESSFNYLHSPQFSQEYEYIGGHQSQAAQLLPNIQRSKN